MFNNASMKKSTLLNFKDLNRIVMQINNNLTHQIQLLVVHLLETHLN